MGGLTVDAYIRSREAIFDQLGRNQNGEVLLQRRKEYDSMCAYDVSDREGETERIARSWLTVVENAYSDLRWRGRSISSPFYLSLNSPAW